MKLIPLGCILLIAVFFATPITAQWRFNGSNVRLTNNNNRVAIGTGSTSYKLEVLRTDGDFRIARFRNSASFGDGTALIDIQNSSGNLWRYGVGGLNNGLSLTSGQFYIESLGIGAVLTIPTSGNIGIGTTDPSSYKVKIVHGAFGFDLGSSSGDDWEQVVFSDGLYLYANGINVGHFDEASGQYFFISDERLKTDIKPMPSVLEKVNQLKPSTYHFKNAKSAPESIGFVAQDVAKLFPGLVQHNVNSERGLDVYTLNYNGISVVAIRAIQELQQKLQEQDQQIEAQNQKIEKLNELVSKLLNVQNEKASSNAYSKGAADIILNNTTMDASPNPAQNSTSIRYSNIPSGFKNAKVVITNNSGATLKLIQLSSNSGSVNINTSGFLNGTYDCSLIVDGNIILNKKIIVAK